MSIYTSGRARRSLIDTVVLRALSQLATVVGYIVLVRGLTKDDFGVFSLLYAFVPLFSTVASLGLEQTLRRYLPEYLRAGRADAAGWLVKRVASLRLGSNVVALAVILLAWNQVAPLLKLTPYRDEFLIICAIVLLNFQARLLDFSLAANMLQRYSVGSAVILATAKLIGYGLIAWQDALTLERALIVDTVAFAITYSFLAIAYRRFCVDAVRAGTGFRIDAPEGRRLFRYAAFNNFNDAGTVFLDSRTDNFFIAAMLDAVRVGAYSFYNRLNEMAQSLLPVRLFESIVQPMVFAVSQEEADEKLPRYFTFLLNTNLILQLPILAFSLAFHRELVDLVFGGKFVEYSWLLPVIAGFATLNVIDVPVTLIVQYEEKAGTLLLSKAFGAYNVAALLVLIPLLGIAGAAIASGSAQVFKYAFIWWNVRRRGRWLNARSVLTIGLAWWSVVVVACIVTKNVLHLSPLGALIMGAAMLGIGVLGYVRGSALSKSDRMIMGALLSTREKAILRKMGILPDSIYAESGASG